MTNFLTAATAMSESPLIRFLAGIALLVAVAKVLRIVLGFIANLVCDDMVNTAALAIGLELAQTDDDPGGQFITTRQEIATLETSEERR